MILEIPQGTNLFKNIYLVSLELRSLKSGELHGNSAVHTKQAILSLAKIYPFVDFSSLIASPLKNGSKFLFAKTNSIVENQTFETQLKYHNPEINQFLVETLLLNKNDVFITLDGVPFKITHVNFHRPFQKLRIFERVLLSHDTILVKIHFLTPFISPELENGKIPRLPDLLTETHPIMTETISFSDSEFSESTCCATQSRIQKLRINSTRIGKHFSVYGEIQYLTDSCPHLPVKLAILETIGVGLQKDQGFGMIKVSVTPHKPQ